MKVDVAGPVSVSRTFSGVGSVVEVAWTTTVSATVGFRLRSMSMTLIPTTSEEQE